MKTFDAAIRVAKADPRQAPKLLQAFGEPFAVYSADENRRARLASLRRNSARPR